MGGRITYVPEPESTHSDLRHCPGMPMSDIYPRGTQWTCNECDRIWVVVEGVQYNEPYTAWRVLNGRNRDGRDV